MALQSRSRVCVLFPCVADEEERLAQAAPRLHRDSAGSQGRPGLRGPANGHLRLRPVPPLRTQV